MINLTQKLLESENHSKILTTNNYLSIIKEYIDFFYLELSWDEGEEEWGFIKDKKNLLGVYNAKFPLLFVINDFFESTITYFEKKKVKSITIEKVDNWNEDAYTIDILEVNHMIDWHSSIPTSKFSINDFWFATI